MEDAERIATEDIAYRCTHTGNLSFYGHNVLDRIYKSDCSEDSDGSSSSLHGMVMQYQRMRLGVYLVLCIVFQFVLSFSAGGGGTQKKRKL